MKRPGGPARYTGSDGMVHLVPPCSDVVSESKCAKCDRADGHTGMHVLNSPSTSNPTRVAFTKDDDRSTWVAERPTAPRSAP